MVSIFKLCVCVFVHTCTQAGTIYIINIKTLSLNLYFKFAHNMSFILFQGFQTTHASCVVLVTAYLFLKMCFFQIWSMHQYNFCSLECLKSLYLALMHLNDAVKCFTYSNLEILLPLVLASWDVIEKPDINHILFPFICSIFVFLLGTCHWYS